MVAATGRFLEDTAALRTPLSYAPRVVHAVRTPRRFLPLYLEQVPSEIALSEKHLHQAVIKQQVKSLSVSLATRQRPALSVAIVANPALGCGSRL